MAVRGGATPSRHVATHDRFATQNPKTLMECWVCTTYDTRHTTGATHADETGRHLRATREDAATTCKKKGKCYSPIFARTHQRLHHFFQFLNPLVALLLVGASVPIRLLLGAGSGSALQDFRSGNWSRTWLRLRHLRAPVHSNC